MADADSDWRMSCTDDDPSYPTIAEGLKVLEEANQLIGHNILKFDLPALEKVTLSDWPNPFGNRPPFDTLVMSRLLWPEIRDNDFKLTKRRNSVFPKNMIGRHSLESWGYRLGVFKGDFGKDTHNNSRQDWSTWSRDMQDYCEQDVEVTIALLRKIEEKEPSAQSIELEHKFQYVISLQEEHGFPFDEEGAQALHRKLAARRAELETELQKAFPPWEVRTPFMPKANNKKLGYEKGVLTYKVQTKVFNPASRDHCADRLQTVCGWEPTEFTDNGKPKVDETTLGKLPFPEAKLLKEYFLLQKRLGQLSEGKQAWLKVARDGRIHGRVTTNGAVTGRCTHQSPNMAQVPSVKAMYGRDCRALFTVLPGFKLVGADASGLELRCLAHMMSKWDGGGYGRELLEGDIHTANQQAAGLPTRDNAKTFIYAFLYGAGDQKIGSIVKPGASEQTQKSAGKKLKKSFFAQVPAVKQLKEAVGAKVKKHGFLRGIDGRKLHIRSEHSALNTLLQSAGGLVVKWATVLAYEELCRRGYIHGVEYAFVAHVHDEMQVMVREDLADEVGQILVQAIRDAGEYFGFKCPLDGEYKIGNNWAETH